MPSGNLTYSLSTLTGGSPLEYARFIDPNHWDSTFVKYEEAAILLDGLRQTGPGLLLDLTADYQYALWLLFTPSVVPPNATAQTLLNDATHSVQQGGAFNQLLYSELRIYTPTTAYASNQEFLQMGSPTSFPVNGDLLDPIATPEAAPGILVGIGMAAIALSLGARRLLRRRKGASTSGGTPQASAR